MTIYAAYQVELYLQVGRTSGSSVPKRDPDPVLSQENMIGYSDFGCFLDTSMMHMSLHMAPTTM